LSVEFTQYASTITQYAKNPLARCALTENSPGNPCAPPRATREGMVRLRTGTPHGSAILKPAARAASAHRRGDTQSAPARANGLLPGQCRLAALLRPPRLVAENGRAGGWSGRHLRNAW